MFGKGLILLLKKVDFYGISFSFMINKESQYRTTFGGVLSISISIIIVLAGLFYFNQAASRSKYTFDSMDVMKYDPNYMYTNQQNLTLQFEMLSKEGESIFDERLFNFKLVYKRANETTLIEIPLKACGLNQKMKCLDPTYNDTIILYGSSKIKDGSYLNFFVDQCVGKTRSGLDCYDDQKKKEMLLDATLSVSFPQVDIDMTNLLEPGRQFIKNEFHDVDYGVTKHINYNFKNFEFLSDDNMLYIDYTSYSYIAFDSYSENTKNYDDKTTMIKLQVGTNSISSKIFRQYFKLAQVFVNLGGITSSLFVVGGIITQYINSIRMNLFIMNRLFDFIEDDTQYKDFKRKSEMNSVDDFLKGTMSKEKSGSNLGKRTELAEEKDPPPKMVDEPPKHTEMVEISIDNSKMPIENRGKQSIRDIIPISPENLNRTSVINKATNSQLNFMKKKQSKYIDIDMYDVDLKKETKREKKELQLGLLDIPEYPEVLKSNLDKSGTISRTVTADVIKEQDNALNKQVTLSPAKIVPTMTKLLRPTNESNNNLCDDSEVDYELLDKILDHEHKRNKKFTLSYSQIIKLIACPCCKNDKNGKIKLYAKAAELMATTFDVVEIYRQLQKINGFISFFLSTKQLNVLQYLERPKVFFKNFLTANDQNKKMIDLIKCFNSYKELKMKKNNLINNRLLENFDMYVREQFDQMIDSN